MARMSSTSLSLRRGRNCSRSRAHTAGRSMAFRCWNSRPLSAIESLLRPESQITVFHASEVELNKDSNLLLEHARKTKPARVVFDSLSEFRLMAVRDVIQPQVGDIGLLPTNALEAERVIGEGDSSGGSCAFASRARRTRPGQPPPRQR